MNRHLGDGSIKYESTSENSLKLTYKENEFNDVIVTKWKYEDSIGCGRESCGNMELNSFGNITRSGMYGKNSAFFRDDDVLTMTIEWKEDNNNHQEAFKLRAVNEEKSPKKLKKYLQSN
ncbi:MAG: hypothetical protein K9L17_05545 [Clostridiales bacterium]|nr:hypothetical protein [Clostridiales bacterium]MCF8022135.1 hypothetical protein [Clostridiales bacterium]